MRSTAKPSTLLPILLILSGLWETGHGAPPPLLDDRAVTIHKSGDVTKKRNELVRYIWGAGGFPKRRLPDIVVTNVPSPVKGLSHLARVDEFRVDQSPGLQGLAYHFSPARPNRELVVVHHGHACTLDDDPSPREVGYGLQRTINALLREGYGVLGVFMPHMSPGDCTGGHDALMRSAVREGSPMKYFLDPIAVCLNHLRMRSQAGNFPKYRSFHMTGLSGGGWTTTVYAAVDTAIRRSFPVAGSIPLYLRQGGSVGDLEQFEPSFYSIAGYPDLYLLGAHGRGRQQVQILVRRDDCCFGQAQHSEKTAGLDYEQSMREYEGRVQQALRRTGQGSFQVVIDEVAPSHMISHHAIENVILPGLRLRR